MRKNFLIIGLSGMLLICISFGYKYYNLNIFSIFPLTPKQLIHLTRHPYIYFYIFIHMIALSA